MESRRAIVTRAAIEIVDPAHRGFGVESRLNDVHAVYLEIDKALREATKPLRDAVREFCEKEPWRADTADMEEALKALEIPPAPETEAVDG